MAQEYFLRLFCLQLVFYGAVNLLLENLNFVKKQMSLMSK